MEWKDPNICIRKCSLPFRLVSLIAMFLCAEGTRIELKPRGPAVPLEGEVEKGKEVFFVFSAKAGSKFTGHLVAKSGKAGFAVDDPDGKGLPEEEFDFNTDLTGSLTKTGDYKISVTTFETRRVHFSLTVRIY